MTRDPSSGPHLRKNLAIDLLPAAKSAFTKFVRNAQPMMVALLGSHRLSRRAGSRKASPLQHIMRYRETPMVFSLRRRETYGNPLLDPRFLLQVLWALFHGLTVTFTLVCCYAKESTVEFALPLTFI